MSYSTILELGFTVPVWVAYGGEWLRGWARPDRSSALFLLGTMWYRWDNHDGEAALPDRNPNDRTEADRPGAL